jgi:hypothetical protein
MDGYSAKIREITSIRETFPVQDHISTKMLLLSMVVGQIPHTDSDRDSKLLEQRISILYFRNVPGPGTYEDKNIIYSKIGGIISRDLRGSRNTSFTPGPGKYNNTDIRGIASK